MADTLPAHYAAWEETFAALGLACPLEFLIRHNGKPTALIVARDDAFGQRVADAVAQRLTARGVTPTIQPYNPESEAYGGDVAAALAAGPAQIVLIGYAELADFIGGFIEQGVLPSAFPMTVVTDRLDQALFRRFAQPGVLNGLVAVGVGSERAALDGEGLLLSQFVHTPHDLSHPDAANRAQAVENWKRAVEVGSAA